MKRNLCSCLGRSLKSSKQSEWLSTQQARSNATKPAEPIIEKVDEGPGPPVITIQSIRASKLGTVATKAIVPMDADVSPPSAASSVGAMSFGALGAVAVAALGAFGVYQMSWFIANKSGRSMDADGSTVSAVPVLLTGELLSARKAAMEAEYAALRASPHSREIAQRIRQLQAEAEQMQ